MAKKRAAFTANPYKFARSLLDKEPSGKLETSLEEVEKYLHVTHSDPNREDALGDCDRTEPVKEPEKQLDVSEPKERNSKTVNQLRKIWLLNVEEKIFYAILAKRLTSFLTGNSYIDTSVQKGRVSGFSGC